MSEKAITDYFNGHYEELKKEFLDLLGKMIKEPTVNVVESKLADYPFLKVRGEETRVARIVKEWAEKEGFPYDTHARIPERENVILYYGDRAGKKLFVPGHMDVVPAGDGWKTDPFEMVIKGDTIYGRGVLDDKGPLASSMLAMKLLKDAGVKLKGELQVGAVADEEAQGEDGVDYGLEFLLEEGYINADFSIVPDIGGEMKLIDVAEKGRVLYQVKAYGKQAHGSTPEKGINAIDNMAEFLVRLKKHKFEYTVHPVLGHYTVNVGEIWGGAAPNIVPGECTVNIDMRLVPGQSPEAVKKELESLSQGLEAKFTVEIKAATMPHEVSPDSELVKTIQEVTKEVTGTEPKPFGMGGGTYAKFLNEKGIEAVGFAPGNEDAFHMANEFASVSELLSFAHVLALVTVKLLGAE